MLQTMMGTWVVNWLLPAVATLSTLLTLLTVQGAVMWAAQLQVFLCGGLGTLLGGSRTANEKI